MQALKKVTEWAPAEESANQRPWDGGWDSKWITDLNLKCKTVKLIEDNIGENLDNLELDNSFLDTTLKSWSEKEIIYKVSFIKITAL